MFNEGTYRIGRSDRYSAKNNLRPTNFTLIAPKASAVSVIGEFNDWKPNAHPMKKQPDGGWHIQIPLTHGHHQYLFLVDGAPMLDPRAQGTSRNANNEKVSLIAIS